MKKVKSVKNFIRLFSLLVVFLGLFILLAFPSFFLKREFFVKEAEHQKVGEIIFVPTITGDFVTRIDAAFKSGNSEVSEKISAFSFRLVYPVEEGGGLKVISVDGNETEEMSVNKILVNSGGWEVPVNKIFRADGNVYIDFAAVYTGTTGFSAPGHVSIATIYFDDGTFQQSDLMKLRLEKEYSLMYTKKPPVENILVQSERFIIGL